MSQHAYCLKHRFGMAELLNCVWHFSVLLLQQGKSGATTLEYHSVTVRAFMACAPSDCPDRAQLPCHWPAQLSNLSSSKEEFPVTSLTCRNRQLHDSCSPQEILLIITLLLKLHTYLDLIIWSDYITDYYLLWKFLDFLYFYSLYTCTINKDCID